MLPQSHKVSKQREVARLAKNGRGFRSVFFMMKMIQNNLLHDRWVIVISAKVSKKAVIRNRLRRQIREIIRLDLLGRTSGFDCMLMVKQEAIGKTYDELRQDLIHTYEKSIAFNRSQSRSHRRRPHNHLSKNNIPRS